MGTLTTYCTVKGIRFDIATVTPNELDTILQKFYLELRKQDGNLYKKTTFRAIRNGIQRKLKDVRQIDIVNDGHFTHSNNAFQAQCVQLKKMWLGEG